MNVQLKAQKPCVNINEAVEEPAVELIAFELRLLMWNINTDDHLTDLRRGLYEIKNNILRKAYLNGERK